MARAMKPRYAGGGVQYPGSDPNCAVPVKPHVVAVHAGVSHPACVAAHRDSSLTSVICSNARLLRAELRDLSEGTSACRSDRGVAPAVRPALSPTPKLCGHKCSRFHSHVRP